MDLADEREPLTAKLGVVLPAILENTPLPVWVVASDGSVLYANPSAMRLLGYDRAVQVLGHPSHDLLHGRRPDGTRFPAEDCRMLDPVVTGEPMSGDEEWFLRADGSFVPVSWSSAPIDLPGGRGVIHSFVDLTARYALEQETREREVAEIRRTQLKEAHLRLMADVAAARQQIVRDLHDGAQQRLVGVALRARLLQESLGDSATAATTSLLDDLVDDAQAAIDELRELVAGIHPPILTSRGVVAAIRSRADHCPIPTTVTGDLGARRLSPLIESNAYFLAAEALTNAVKHSKATRIEVDVSLGEVLTVTIADDGVGGLTLDRAGSGVHSMRDRVHAFDGVVEIDSPPGRGTRIRARIPVEP